MKLVLTALLTAILSMTIYVADKKTAFGKLLYRRKQIIIGVLFGIVTCLATEYGLQIPGAVINARDAAPLCAALLFGGPSGILAGLIGGIHRLFWGTTLSNTFTVQWISTMFSVDVVGGFSRLACILGTICSGFFGALMRKYMFDNKRPTWFYGLALGLTTETFHLFLLFIFRLNYLSRVFKVIKVCTFPMIIANVATVTISIIAVTILGGEKRKKATKEHDLAGAFQVSLLTSVIVAFCATTIGMFLIQYKLGVKQTEATLQKNLSDIEKRIDLDGGIDRFIANDFTWHVGNSGGIIIGEITFNESGQLEKITVVLNGEEYNKGEVINSAEMTGGHVYKTAENFFEATIHINGEDTPIYGMYMLSGNKNIVISYVPIEEATLYQGITIYLTAFFEILVFAALFVQVYYLIKKLVVENLIKINGTLAEITGGNLNAVVDVRSHSEFASLSDDINHTVATLKHYIAEAAARIDRELEFAKAIQHSALPNVFPPYPNRREFDIHATMDTAKEVGGDFYDFYFVDEDKLAFLIADVSGKGIPAAMFMMTAKTFLKSYAESGLPVNEVFTITNEKLCEGNEAGMFVTAFMGVIDLKTGLVKFANAGHNPPLICRKTGGFEFFRSRAGFVLAGMEGIQYREGELTLEPGDTMYLYTDGVTEATDGNNRLYGEARLQSVLNGSKGMDMRSLCKRVKDDVDLFVGEAEQFDDITMVAFCYKGQKSNVKELVLDATIENIEKVTDFINTELDTVDCSMKARMQIDVAVDEIFSNIAQYAYDKNIGKATVRVEIGKNPPVAIITFIDSGVPFNPLDHEDPDTTLSTEEREVGGLGIFMVKKTMDDISYDHNNGQNILIIEKTLKDF